MEEESHTSSDRDHNDAFPLKGGEPLDFEASSHVLSVFSSSEGTILLRASE
jgi:hypothetical protein